MAFELKMAAEGGKAKTKSSMTKFKSCFDCCLPAFVRFLDLGKYCWPLREGIGAPSKSEAAMR